MLWLKDVYDMITNDEDKIFLRNMETSRTFVMGGVDNKTTITEKKLQARRAAKSKREELESARKKYDESSPGTSHSLLAENEQLYDDTESDDSLEAQPAQEPKKLPHRSIKKTGETLYP